MSIESATIDRRRRRSDEPSQAIHFFLRSVAERGGHTAVALADPTGYRVAGAGSEDVTRRLAAAAPLAFSNPDLLPNQLRGSGGIDVWSVVLGETAYYVATAGGNRPTPRNLRAALGRLLLTNPEPVAAPAG